mgnify:CR=1 FL=1
MNELEELLLKRKQLIAFILACRANGEDHHKIRARGGSDPVPDCMKADVEAAFFSLRNEAEQQLSNIDALVEALSDLIKRTRACI